MNLRRVTTVIGVLMAVFFASVTTHLWFVAHARGGSTMIAINIFHERYLEYAIWFIVWPIIAIALHTVLNHYDVRSNE